MITVLIIVTVVLGLTGLILAALALLNDAATTRQARQTVAPTVTVTDWDEVRSTWIV